MLIDYATLRIIWWILLGVVLVGFAIMDGFDLGVAMLLPWVARNDLEKRVVINTVGPVWEGNQVWFILGGGAIFAAWPLLYAVSFSGFYLAMMTVLLALILRPVAFKYRSKIASTYWRGTWDSVLCFCGLVPTFIFGVAFGNVLQGIPFSFDINLRMFYQGSFFALLNPFALFCGCIGIFMLSMHGGRYLSFKTEAPIAKRALMISRYSALLLIISCVIGAIWLFKGISGYKVVTQVLHDAPSNPLHKQVIKQAGAWLDNFSLYPWMLIAPLVAIFGALINWLVSNFNRIAFVASSLSIAGVITTIGFCLFPFLIPSSNMPNHSLIIWDTSSSQLTLFVMLIVAVIFIPIILAYTSWVYYVMRGKVTIKDLSNEHY